MRVALIYSTVKMIHSIILQVAEREASQHLKGTMNNPMKPREEPLSGNCKYAYIFILKHNYIGSTRV